MAQLIPLTSITRNPRQPREAFPVAYIEELAASIKARGLIQPITVREHGDGFQIVAGECRYRAHQLLGRDNIAAEIVSIDDREMQLRAIVENLQRRDMNPIEEANAFQCLLDIGYDVNDIVRELGLKSPALVRQRLQLLSLTPEIQQLVRSGNLTAAIAWGVAIVPQRLQAQMVRDIAAGRLKTAEQVRHAGIALRDAEAQLDAFASEPLPSAKDRALVKSLEGKIESITDMVLAGWKDGECVAAQRVSPDRVKTMADRLALLRSHILKMEHELRRAAAQTEMKLNVSRRRTKRGSK